MKKVVLKLQKQFDKMCQTGKLFRSNISGDDIYDLYLKGFKAEDNPIFRDPDSSSHNCNTCKGFIKKYSNVIALTSDNKIMTIFDVKGCGEYQSSFDAISKAIKTKRITGVFVETFNNLNSLPFEVCKRTADKFQLGLSSNVKVFSPEEARKYGGVTAGKAYTFNHINLTLPSEFVDKSGKSIADLTGDYREAQSVFKRGMETISLSTLELVESLIEQDSILNGAAHLKKIKAIIPLKKEYNALPEFKKDRWCWKTSKGLGLAKFRNDLIGVLCVEIEEENNLEKACTNWNKRVDPANYKKAKAPISQKQIDEAEKFVAENGYTESFDRRVAVPTDINVNEIKHINDGGGKIKSVSMFSGIKPGKTSSNKGVAHIEGAETVSIEEFMSTMLPHCTRLDAYLDNSHENNLVTMTTSNVEGSRPIFAWDNNYSWTYNGNLAGKSMIKENVSKVGGNINAIVRASLQWNDEDTPGIVDFDLHSKGENHIYYSNRGRTHSCGGHLDVDMINPKSIGIENLTWKNKISDGTYEISVNNFNGNRNTGFKVEIEINGDTYNYINTGNIQGITSVATIYAANGAISIKHHLPELHTSKDLYGLTTKKFHKVNLMCLSPNHWGNNEVGNKHYFFMLEGCSSPNRIRSFHIENLIGELHPHRKVLEVLGAVNMLEPTGNDELSGLGFNATVRDSLILKLEGKINKLIKVVF